MRWIGIDLHKHYFHVVELAADGTNKSYRVAIPGGFGEFCAGLGPADQVVLEASTSSFRFGELVANHAGRVLISEPRQTRGVVSKPAMNDLASARPTSFRRAFQPLYPDKAGPSRLSAIAYGGWWLAWPPVLPHWASHHPAPGPARIFHAAGLVP